MSRKDEISIDFSDKIIEAKEGKTLNKPFRTPSGPKKFSVYVKNEKGNVVKVNFGDPNMEIKRDDPERRKSFRARHNCDNPGPKWKARYWSCRQWRSSKKVEGSEWDGETFVDQQQLLDIYPALANAQEITECEDCESDAYFKKRFANMKPSGDETHDDYMSRCQKAGHSEEDCMKSHEGHKFKEQNAPHTEEDHAKRGLWDNIRDKKKREGDDYKPAKPGDPDRPSKDSWEKAQKPKKKKASYKGKKGY
tara:strand:+ start:969 stop:1718 length:750 start_codon:yes stop_codon:yes gene_type:complete